MSINRIPQQLDIDDVAAISKRTPKAIRQLRARNLGPKFRKVDGRLLTDEDEVARWLAGDEDDEPATSTVVARAISKGGTCAGCGRRIKRGEQVVKLDTGERGGTTTGGNGLGKWVGVDCCFASLLDD